MRAGNTPNASQTAPASAAAQAAAQAAQAAVQAATLAEQAQNPLRQALDAVRQWQAAQDAARTSAQATLPSVPNGLVPGGLDLAVGGLQTGAAVQAPTTNGGRTEVTVTQSVPRAILTWNTFNVGAQTDVQFDQTKGGTSAPSWVALNRVLDPSGNPSQILGTISAQGQVYIINRNGVIFGGTSQVSVGSLLASGLDIVVPNAASPSDSQYGDYFTQGAVLYNLSFAGPGGSAPGSVTVDAGARIAAASGGRVTLLGGEVRNAGSLDAPDGQVFLAAGSALTLGAGDLATVVGLAAPTSITPDGVVENTGMISANRGNVTLVAAQTSQDGMVAATTGALTSGFLDIGLDGGKTSFGPGSVTQVLPDVGGKKVVGTGSDWRPSQLNVHGDEIVLHDGATIYLPAGDVTLRAAMTSDPTNSGIDDTRIYVGSGARIDVSGLRNVQVPMEQNSIEAQLRANELADDPLLRNNPAFRGQTIWFDARLGVNGQVANVSGYYDLLERDVSQLMTNAGHVNLVANTIVTRQGSVIDLSGGSLSYQGGFVKSSVLIDPAGRQVPIEKAVPGVAYVAIDGEFTVDHGRWGIVEAYNSPFTRVARVYEQGYEQGGNAGSLVLGTNPPAWFDTNIGPTPTPPSPSATASFRVLDGQVKADTVAGPKQRQPNTGSSDPTEVWREQPAGATLVLSNAGYVSVVPDAGPLLGASFGPDSKLDPSLQYQVRLPESWFNGSAPGAAPTPGVFRSVNIGAGYDPDVSTGAAATINRAYGGYLTIGPGVAVDLGDGGSFAFTGTGAEIAGTILAPGGSVALAATHLPSAQTVQGGADPNLLNTVHVASTGTIDTAGRLTNDFLDGSTGPVRAVNGGSISLSGARVVLDPGSLVDVSGGAQVNAAGSKATAGKGGSISIDVSQAPLPSGLMVGDTPPAFNGTLTLGGTLSGYSLGQGGSLAVKTGYDVVVADALPAADAGSTYRLFAPSFFTQGGFSSYTVTGSRSVTVAAGTTLAPSTETLSLPGSAQASDGSFSLTAGSPALSTGTRLDDVLGRQVLPVGLRKPMSVTLSTLPAATGSAPVALTVEKGATIELGGYPGSTVRLGSSETLEVAGTVAAPGGSIALVAQGLSGQGSVRLDPSAQLTASGYQLAVPVANGQVVRSVQPGGTVAITATGAADIEPGAVIDVSGVHGVADLPLGNGGSPSNPAYAVTEVDGSAGSIRIAAASGLVGGTLRLAPGGPSGVGGSLTVAKVTPSNAPIVVTQSVPATGAGGPALTVVADAVNASGADDLTLQTVAPGAAQAPAAEDAILFSGSVSLRTRNSITLVAPILGTVANGQPTTTGAVTLASHYVDIQGEDVEASLPEVGAQNLASSLTIRADFIDVARTVLLGCSVSTTTACSSGGFGWASLVSTGDIRLSDRDAAGNASPYPGLLSPGEIGFQAAQVYVGARQEAGTSLERPPGDAGFLVFSAEKISVAGNGNPAPVPQSFGERLTLEAPVIDQGGVLRAPQGQLFLLGTGPTGSVTLEGGSVTSASLDGATVAFGPVQTGGVFYGYANVGQGPTKSVTLSAANVSVQKGAVLDVSGGGDLQGYLWTSGNGGSQDILSSSKGFAVVPSLGTSPAPIAPTGALSDSRISAGETIFLQGVPGLPDGSYTLLPAHYALLPGGFLVVPLGGAYATPVPTAHRPDGSLVASGAVSRSGSPGYAQFLVMPQSVFESYSQLATYSFNTFASALAAQAGSVARTPNDAGAVVLIGSQTLELAGTGRFGAGANGLLGTLDISAPYLAVLGAGAAAPTDKPYVAIDVQSLEAFGAGSVLVGGTRAESTSTTVTVNAKDVLVNTGAGTWSGPEILLVATDAVTVANGSTIRASAPASGTVSLDTNPLVLAPPLGSPPGANNDGALLRLSAGTRVPIVRDGAQGSTGDLVVGTGTGSTGATLSAAGSLSLDGSSSVSVAPSSSISARQLDLASTQVNLGDAPAGTPGVTLGTNELLALASSSDLLLRGYNSIDIFGSVAIGSRDGTGSATLQALTLDTGLVQGHPDAAGNARITAGTLVLQDSGGGGAGTGGAGTLTLDLDQLRLGPGDVRLAGFGALAGKAGTIAVQGQGSLAVQGGLSLATTQVSAASNANYAVNATGDLSLAGTGATPRAGSGGIGARLALEGATITLDTRVLLPGGTFEATADTGAVQVGPSAVVDVRGVKVTLEDQSRFAPGGSIALGAAGDLVVASGAVLDVSAAADGGSAGLVTLTAGGRASLGGTLRGEAAAGQAGGSFSVDAGSVGAAPGDLSSLFAALGTSGFDTSIAVRTRTQDITVASGDRIGAHQVTLRADGGLVTVAGEIAASGTADRPDGGTIAIAGGSGVQVAATAKLEAQAQAATAASGRVEIAAGGGRLDVAPGAAIDVSGGRSGGGLVVLRAPRDGADVAIDRMGATVAGARQVVVQGTASYQATQDPTDAATGDLTPALAAQMVADAAQWLQGSAAILGRLGGGNPAFQLAPAMLVTAPGNLAVLANVDLSTIASGKGTPGYLGLRAGGNLDVRAVVSDGFASADRSAALLGGASFTYALEAGGDVILEKGAMLRTGTGSISVRAGRDISLGDPTAAIYTAGARSDTPSSFLGAPAGMPIGEFPSGGGDLSLRAGRDVSAPMATETTSAWLYRYGDSGWAGSSFTVNDQTSWSVNFPNFQGVGALGGGNVTVTAGRDVAQLQASIPTSGFLTAAPGTSASSGDLVVHGGGDLSVSAGGDVLGGLFVVGRGQAAVRAGGSVAPSATLVGLRTRPATATLGAGRTVGVLFGLMDATATITAGSGVYIEGVFDPMRQGQIASNLSGTGGSAFSGYTERTSFTATSLGGSVRYENDPWASTDLTLTPGLPAAYAVRMSGSGTNSMNDFFSRAPPTLSLVSLQGSVVVEDHFSVKSTLTLAPAPRGTLDLLAWEDVRFPIGKVQIEDVASAYVRGPLAPMPTQGDILGSSASPLVPGDATTNNLAGFTPLHAGDPDPVRIYAVVGSVCAQQSGACLPDPNPTSQTASVIVPKPVLVVAGRDILAGTFEPQNNSPTDISSFVAGRDVYEPVILARGDGTLVVQAGRDVVFQQTGSASSGSSSAPPRGGEIISLGNRTDPSLKNVLTNAALPDRGADVYVLAGTANGVNYDGFAAAYLDPANAQGVVKTYLPELGVYMTSLGYGALAGADLVKAFQALPLLRREVFLDQVYFSELKATGIDYNDAESPRYHSYDRGFRAVSLLFPKDPSQVASDQRGDVVLSAKPVETQSDASIDILAPYGSVLVGADVLPRGVDPATGGMVTRRGGDIRIMADQDIALATSRVFTLQGGDITMWTSNGSITAGSGSKTSVFQVPLEYSIDNAGVVRVDAFGLATGAGIGVLDALQNASDRPPSRLDLIAPRGEVNAGDAGIRVVGDINIAAAVVVGVDNIQVTGNAVGVPKVEAPNVSAFTSATQLAQAATQEGVGPEAAAAARKNTVADLPSIITVEVVGYETTRKAGDAPEGAEDKTRRRGGK